MTDAKHTQFIGVYVTAQMEDFIKLLASRHKVTVSDIVRQALRDYLDVQEDVIGSRSRLGNRIARQLEEMQNRFLKQYTRTTTLLLAAVILLQMKQGMQGSDVLAQIEQLAGHAGGEIQAVLEAKE